MLWDTHMHCHFSGDSDADPKDMISAAIQKGLDGICFTDHQDFDYKEMALKYESESSKKTKLQDTLIVLHKIKAPMEVILLVKKHLKEEEEKEKRKRDL